MKTLYKSLQRLTVAVIVGISACAVQAQDAFYVYQNDGRFEGFFYDQIIRMYYAKTDTAGQDYDEYVSQIIETHDSTYCFMLSAIDSISFVQPEIKFNPRLRDVKKDPVGGYILKRNGLNITLVPETPADVIPRVGDVLVDFDIDNSWGGKVRNVEVGATWVYVECDSLEDISDIFSQFVTVEQIDKDRNGNLLRRRIAGMPEMTIGRFPSNKEEGGFEGTIFNFSLSRHLPIYTSPGGDVNISIDPNLTAALSVKASCNLPLWGDKYISVVQNLDLSLSMGFTIDGKISDVFPANINQFGKMPLPAAAPILVLDFGPDGFLRGEWHGKFAGESPKAQGRIWQKWEIRNWWPSYSLGIGKAPEDEKKEPEPEEPNTESLTFEFNGFVQTGLKFPLVLRNNGLLDKVFKANLGGTMYIGPKISGAVAFDVENWIDEGFDIYRTMKESKITISPISADYEIKANVKTLLTAEREWTMMDGSMSLISDINLFFFPDFKDIELYEKTSGFVKEQYAIVNPTRNVVWPLQVGLGIYKKKGNAEKLVSEHWHSSKYYQLFAWTQSKDPLDYPHFSLNSLKGKYVLRPIFKFLGKTVKAEPALEYTAPGPYVDLANAEDTISAEAQNGIVKVLFETNCDSVSLDLATYYYDTCIVSRVSAEKMMAEIHLPSYYHFSQPLIMDARLFGKLGDDWTYSDKFVIRFEPNQTAMPTSLFMQAIVDQGGYPNPTFDSRKKGAQFSARRSGDLIHVAAECETPYTNSRYIDGKNVEYTGVIKWKVVFDINTKHPDFQTGYYKGRYVVQNSLAEYSNTYTIEGKEYTEEESSFNFDGTQLYVLYPLKTEGYKPYITYDGQNNPLKYNVKWFEKIFSGNDGDCNLSLTFEEEQ